MTPEYFIKGQVAEFAWREGSHLGGVDNMLALAFVIRNRVQAGWHGGSWLRVIEHAHESGAYEMCFCEAGCARCVSTKQPDITDTNFRVLLSHIDDIYSGLMPDRFAHSAKGEPALFYAELNHISREWFRENICRRPEEHERIAQVGLVSFFK